MKQRINLAWVLILFGLALTTTGWALKLDGHAKADACIVVGNGLVFLFGALALWKLVRWLDVGLRGPLCIIVVGLLLSSLATSILAANASMALAVAGGLMAAVGTGWLLVRLNRTLDRSLPGKRRRYLA